MSGHVLAFLMFTFDCVWAIHTAAVPIATTTTAVLLLFTSTGVIAFECAALFFTQAAQLGSAQFFFFFSLEI